MIDKSIVFRATTDAASFQHLELFVSDLNLVHIVFLSLSAPSSLHFTSRHSSQSLFSPAANPMLFVFADMLVPRYKNSP